MSWAAAALTCALLLLAPPTLATEQLSEISTRNASYCAIFSREMVFIEALHGEPLTADTDVILARAKAHYSDCLAVLPALMPLPEDTGSLKTWLADIRDLLVLTGTKRVASIGVEPATEKPVRAADPSPEGWAEACAAMWQTFDPADGTVIRPDDKGGHQRCPLVLVDGVWGIP